MQPNWKKMFLLSFLIHLGVFSLVFFVPESAPTRSLRGVIYEVNLVELPRKAGTGRPVVRKDTRSKKGVTLHTKKRRVRRIGKIKAKEKAVIIAKKVVKRKRKRARKLKAHSHKVLEQALAKLEKKVKQAKREDEESERVDKAISKIEEQMKREEAPGARPGGGTGGPPSGLTIQIYKMEVESRIKSNWAYPVGIANENKRKGLEAIVILTVQRDGTISEYRFKKRSKDPFFDESVTKAIERSNPLPPFPEGFLKTTEEIEINFNLSEFEAA